MEDNYPGVIIRGATIQAPIVRWQFFWGPLSGGQLSGGQLSWGQLNWEAIARASIVRGAIIRGGIIRGAIVRGQAIVLELHVHTFCKLAIKISGNN